MLSGSGVRCKAKVNSVVIKVIEGDITQERTEAIVNSTDSKLSLRGDLTDNCCFLMLGMPFECWRYEIYIEVLIS